MFIKRPDALLYSVAFGSSSRALVAVGGWAGSWEVWTNTLGDLSATWRAVAYDHRGTGASLVPVDSITRANLVQDVFAVLDAHGIERCVLAAESAGAATALLAALDQPHRFDGLVLVDGLYYSPFQAQDSFLYGLQHHFEATIAQFVAACVPDSEPEVDAVRRWGRQILMRAEQAAAVRLYEVMSGVDLRAQVSQITLPTLIVHGSADAILPVASSQWLAAHLPNSRLAIIDGAGHVPTVTHPHAVAAAINDFFAGLSV